MSDTVIRVENLSKKYIIGHQPNGGYATLRDRVTDTARFVTDTLLHKKTAIRSFGPSRRFHLRFSKAIVLASLAAIELENQLS